MKHPSFLSRVRAWLTLGVCALSLNTHAFTLTLQEQGGLTGAINGGGGPVIINPMGVDHWNVIVQDPRIGNAVGPASSLAFTEPETVFGLTAYNNILVLNVAPGLLSFDVLSDEFSPYAIIMPNATPAPLQNPDVEMITLRFVDFADAVPEPSVLSLLLGGGLWLRCRRAAR